MDRRSHAKHNRGRSSSSLSKKKKSDPSEFSNKRVASSGAGNRDSQKKKSEKKISRASGVNPRESLSSVKSGDTVNKEPKERSIGEEVGRSSNSSVASKSNSTVKSGETVHKEPQKDLSGEKVGRSSNSSSSVVSGKDKDKIKNKNKRVKPVESDVQKKGIVSSKSEQDSHGKSKSNQKSDQEQINEQVDEYVQRQAERSKRSEKASVENGKLSESDNSSCNLGSERYAGKRQLQLVAKLCADNGFEPTKKPMRAYPAGFFKQSGLLQKFDKYLSDKLDKGCNLTREQTETVLLNLRKRRESVPFLAGAVTGVPGSGKTTLLRKIQTEAGLNSVVVLSNERHKNSFSQIPACYTAKELLLLDTDIHFEVLLIDEYTLLNNGEILLLQKIVSARVVVLFGDRAQGSSATLGSPEWLQVPVIFSSTKSHRFGKNIAGLCSKQGFDFQGNDQEDQVDHSEYEGSSPETDINLVFTKETQADLLEVGIGSSLVEEVQGNEYDSVTLFIRDEDKDALSDPHLRAVAFTRARVLLYVRIPKHLMLALFNGELNASYQARTNCYGKEQ
nr:MAG: putative 48 kDa protein [Jiangsu sediment virgavirus]